MPFKDLEKAREYRKKYYLENKEKNTCEHGKRKEICKECGGICICEHGRQKHNCKSCGGSQICIHNKQVQTCITCGGSSFCEHNKRKAVCVPCNGQQICDHGKVRSRCRDCDGSAFSEHKRIKYRCIDCKGSLICEHNKRKSVCSICSLFTHLVDIQRHQIRRVMKLTDLRKTKSSIEYLGCSVEYFKEYIEKKMVEGMTFEYIQYDHIKPVSKFELTNIDDLLDCCHYTNLQPLLAKDNIEKRDKWTLDDDYFWNENIKGKEYLELYFPK